MKIATITYSWAQNWGAVLQAYALTEYLNQLGHEARLIDYMPFDNKMISTVKSLGDGVYDILTLPESIRRIKKYNEFRTRYFKLTSKCCTVEELKELNKQYDIFITGSDQVWNIGHGVNENFYLEFVEKDKKRISYAASFGVSDIPDVYRNDVVTGLNNISCISVREKTGQKLVKNLVGREAEIVLDPVFLLPVEHWSMMSTEINIKEPYIFVYPTQISTTLKNCIHEIKKMTGFQIITPFYISGCKTRKDIGPLEFLSFIKNAKYVIGSSFHAVAFSIIFEKRMYVVTHSQTGSRTTDLLEQLGLETCILRNGESIKKCSWDYEAKRTVINEKIKVSKKFLDDSIN